jgi:hypothetical protein
VLLGVHVIGVAFLKTKTIFHALDIELLREDVDMAFSDPGELLFGSQAALATVHGEMLPLIGTTVMAIGIPAAVIFFPLPARALVSVCVDGIRRFRPEARHQPKYQRGQSGNCEAPESESTERVQPPGPGETA